MNGMLAFWVCIGLGGLNALFFGLAIFNRRLFSALLSGLAAGLILTVAAFTYDTAYGECAGKSGTTVPFHQGMTLCPGQSAVIEMSPIIINTKPEREL